MSRVYQTTPGWPMYLRTLRCGKVVSRIQQSSWDKSLCRQSISALQRPNHSYRPTPNQQRYQHGKTQDDKRKPGKGLRLRPFIVAAICIPLGYTLNWYLKRRDGVDESASSDGFVKYTLTSKENISTTCSIFTLKPASSSPIDVDDPALDRAITSVQFKQPQLQIARNYTLLPRKDGQDPDQLRFLIRRERNGEVSGYLHRLPVGAEIEVRGVFPEYKFPPNIETTVFLTGGTGIAPAMQAAAMLAGESDVHILWASRRREDCAGGASDTIQKPSSWSFWTWKQGEPSAAAEQQKCDIVAELDHLKQLARSKDGHGLVVDYFVDEEGTFIKASHLQKLMQASHPTSRGTTSNGKKILFVSGPDGFVSHWAALKQWQNGHEVQGKLGGVLSTLDLTGWEVVKL